MAEPARIGVYEIQARLGVGGMAETFLALRRGPGGFEQRVCLKRIREDVAREPEAVRQFLAEAAVLARLRHASITQVLDFGRDGEDYYLALELIDGVDLRELLERHPHGLRADVVQYIASEIATALDFAHRAGGEPGASPIVHRDVSSSNVLLSREGEVKLSDFGIARPLDAPKHTRTGIVRGKVPYLAPEYARTARFDPRSDLFSLGVVLYECLSGRRPHDGATELDTLQRAARAQRPPLAEVARDAPEGLVRETEALLEPDPALRTQSAALLLEALLQLPGSPRARRELGALVTACRTACPPSSPPAIDPGALVGPTERWEAKRTPTSGVRESSTAAAPAAAELGGPRVRVGRGARITLIAALAIAAGVVGYAANRQRPQPTAASDAAASAGTRPGGGPTETAAFADPVAPPATVSGALARDGDEAGSKQRNASLEVVVVPYGEVLLDGRKVGSTPITLSVAPGEHTVVGRNRDGSFKRVITLQPGEHKQLVLK